MSAPAHVAWQAAGAAQSVLVMAGHFGQGHHLTVPLVASLGACPPFTGHLVCRPSSPSLAAQFHAGGPCGGSARIPVPQG